MTKKHYWLAAVELTFQDSTGNAAITRVNSTCATDEPFFTMKDVGKIQHGAQLALFNQLNEQLPILNLTILGLSNMGEMTEEQFVAGLIPTGANDG